MKLLPRMLLLRSELEVFGSASFRPHLCRNVLCQRNVVSLVARLRLLLELQSMTIDPDVSQCMTKISGMRKKIVLCLCLLENAGKRAGRGPVCQSVCLSAAPA